VHIYFINSFFYYNSNYIVLKFMLNKQWLTLIFEESKVSNFALKTKNCESIILIKTNFTKIAFNYEACVSSRVWQTPTTFSTFIPSKVIANGSMPEKGESLLLSPFRFSQSFHNPRNFRPTVCGLHVHAW